MLARPVLYVRGATLTAARLPLALKKNAIHDLEAQLDQANQDIERRDGTILTLKKNLRVARDKLASPALGVVATSSPPSSARKAAQQRENQLEVSRWESISAVASRCRIKRKTFQPCCCSRLMLA